MMYAFMDDITQVMTLFHFTKHMSACGCFAQEVKPCETFPVKVSVINLDELTILF